MGDNYCFGRERDDLLAVHAATGARLLFGHSYGGFVALETARGCIAFTAVAVYEPGVPIAGSIKFGSMPKFRELLRRGDTRGAFASFIVGSGHAPSVIARLPSWYMRSILSVVYRGERWRRTERLLEAMLAEHEVEAAMDADTAERFFSVRTRVLLLGGGRSPRFATVELFDRLSGALPGCISEILPGLDHFAPDEKAPHVVARRLTGFFQAAEATTRPR